MRGVIVGHDEEDVRRSGSDGRGGECERKERGEFHAAGKWAGGAAMSSRESGSLSMRGGERVLQAFVGTDEDDVNGEDLPAAQEEVSCVAIEGGDAVLFAEEGKSA